MARPLNKHLPVVTEAPISSILEHVGCSLLGLVNSQGLPFSGAVREGTPGLRIEDGFLLHQLADGPLGDRGGEARFEQFLDHLRLATSQSPWYPSLPEQD